MEDEDVESVNKFGAPTIEKNSLDGSLIVNNDAKNIITSPEKNNSGEEKCESTQEDTAASIDRLKSALINHDALNVDRLNENEEGVKLDSGVSSPSPKKLNGEVDKSEEVDVISLEESCEDNTKNKDESLEEDSKDEEKKEEAKEETPVSNDLKEPAKRKRSSSEHSDVSKGSENESDCESSNSSPVEFRGFKKRKILECGSEKLLDVCEGSEEHIETANTGTVNEADKPKLVELRRSARNAMGAKKHSNEAIINIETKEESGDQLTEYAQYLGLQPTVKFKCGRCGEKHFQSMASLNAHQMICCKTASNALSKQTKPTSDSNLSTNFRITRKVYLCSACGTYYENWKLFLHMRDMHKRHICLFCLGMFSVAERLAEHLLYQHNVNEKTCKSPEEFLNLFKGSCYLTCCSCEKMFTERDDFYDHQCKDSVAVHDAVPLTPKEIKELAQKCTLCGVKCGHFRTCPKVAHKFQQSTQPPPLVSNVNTTNNLPNMSLEKYYVPVPTNVQNNWPSNNLNPEILKQALSLSHSEKDYYDVGSAARFCHVDIANDSDNQHSPEKAVQEKLNVDHKKCPEYDGNKSPDALEASGSKEQEEQQADSSKSLLNNSNNVIVNSVSDVTNHLENRPNSKDCETQNEPPEKHIESLEKESVENNKMSAEDVDEVSTEIESSEKVDEVKDADEKMSIESEDNEVEDESRTISKDNLQCFVKLDRLKNENLVVNCLSTDKKEEEEEENSQHDSITDTSSSSGTDSTTVDSRRNSIDADHNDLSQDNVMSNELVTNTEKEEGDKEETPVEDVSINKEEPVNETLDDSSLNNEEKSSSLSNAEGIDSRFENSNDTTEKSSVSESEESDKLSVDMDEDEQQAKSDDKEEDEVCESVPTGKETDKSETVNDHIEMDITAERTDAECRDACSDDDDGDAVEKVDTENDVSMEESPTTLPQKQSSFQCDGVSIQLASEEVTAMALMLDDKMDSLSSQSVVKECVRTSCTTCSYCSHAVKIGVNGKQLAIHLLTEHRYTPVKNETVEDIIERLKRSLDELEDVWFNTDSYDSSDKNCFVPYDHTYECFQCNYVANTHKDLFSHKRKVHQKTILYCSMCKENFYSYSELLCHMCRGLYDASKDIQFRCCMCASDRIPSAFRLMVHLRKSHHTCDICLEIVEDQQKLSAHMVKHKLHHLCYRCGIAYRNKPDITKHLFWKHGTESVLCKKCLQKKWPHVYHFCIPPNSFVCEECNLSFSKAVYLKVHKRFHNNNLPYTCTTCEQKFVSKKLLSKHEKSHEAITVEENVNNDSTLYKSGDIEKSTEKIDTESGEPQVSAPDTSTCPDQHAEASEKSGEAVVKPHKKKSKKDKDRKLKPVVDVYDLPPLNLSSESDDTEDEKDTRSVATTNNDDDKVKESTTPVEGLKTSEPLNDEAKIKDDVKDVESEVKTTDLSLSESVAETEETAPPITVVDGIWDNFHTYKAEQEKRENLDIANKQSILSQLEPALPPVVPKDTVLGDHDYCLPHGSEEKEKHADETEETSSKTKSNEHSSSIDHDYCTQKNDSLENSNINTSANLLNTSNQSENAETPPKRKQKSPKKKMKQHNNSSSSSDSSSDSDSSSCSCGTNCSCSSSSSNSSSSSSSDSDSSSSDGKNNQSGTSTSKREKKKERLKAKRKGDVPKTTEPLPPAEEEPVTVHVPVEPEELLIKESDLETDETATDEEFYDQYPQMQANQILAEKRNQLMLLASVAPTVNNGTASPPVPNTSSSTNINLDPISSPKLEIVAPPVTPVVQPQTQSKKRVKAKKRRKSSSLSMSRSRKQHNLSYETPQPSTSFSAQWQSAVHSKKVANEISPMYMQSPALPHAVTPASNLQSDDHMLLSSPVTSHHSQSHRHSTGSSETSSSKRFSKRRRVRNKFYGYSSDEDGEHNQAHPPTKWKKFSPVDGKQSVHQQQFYAQPFQHSANTHHEYNHGYQQQLTPTPPPPKIVQPAIRTMFDENQINNNLVTKRTAAPIPLSSGTSSDSDGDSDSDSTRPAINQQTNTTSITTASLNAGATEKDDKLYCYCQCPYDEVSEMIACDGIDCAIEWFHFECVGIMVPPKGKWYCPDCRKRRGLS